MTDSPLYFTLVLWVGNPASTKGLAQDQGALSLEVLPAGEVAKEKSGGTPSRFLSACSFRCQPCLQGFCYTNDREKLAEGRIARFIHEGDEQAVFKGFY